jgi:IS5 family transposase
MRPNSSQVSFADVELQRQCQNVDQALQEISKILDQPSGVVEMVQQDLVRNLRKPRTGRDGLTADQTLRAFVLKQVKNWDLRELRDRIADGLSLRTFTHFFSAPVPKHKAFHRAFCRLRPETVHAINDMVVKWVVAQGLDGGKKVRFDTTVVETDVHHPTDSSLLWDGVRVVTRAVKRIRSLLPQLGVPFVSHNRQARRRMQEIERLTAKQRQTQQVPKYRQLIKITSQVLDSARKVAEAAQAAPCSDLMTSLKVDALVRDITVYGERTDRVVKQARRRVLQGETVPNEDKIFSIFELHTDLIIRGKAHKPVEFGHKVLLAESGRGLITEYRVLEGNPVDSGHVEPVLQHHRQVFGRAAELAAGDRGFYSEEAVAACKAAGVKTECIPQKGGQRTAERLQHEKSRAFREGQRFRAGIEGRISVLLRGRGMRRCLLQGRERFETFVGLCVLANNLLVIVEILRGKASRRRRAAG